MNIDTVTEIFGKLSGLDPRELAGFQFLCISAADTLVQNIVSDGIDDHYQGKIEFAAAALAYYRYVLWLMSSCDDVSVGEISVKKSTASRLDAAKKLFDEAVQNISDIYKGDGFFFENIR